VTMAQLASFNILYTAARLIPISLARAVPIIGSVASVVSEL